MVSTCTGSYFLPVKMLKALYSKEPLLTPVNTDTGSNRQYAHAGAGVQTTDALVIRQSTLPSEPLSLLN